MDQDTASGTIKRIFGQYEHLQFEIAEDITGEFSRMHAFAQVLYIYFDKSGEFDYLRACIDLCKALLVISQDDEEFDRAEVLSGLAVALDYYFRSTGELGYLDQVIEYHREVVSSYPPGHPHRIWALDNYAVSLQGRFQQTAQMDDLEQCIATHREALSLYLPNSPDRAISLDHLAATLHTRFEHLGRFDDLEQCIDLYQNALAVYPPGHVERPTAEIRLASALHTRFEQTQQMPDLERCIDLNAKIVTSDALESQFDKSRPVHNLASALRKRYIVMEDSEDLEGAIELFHAALEMRPPGHPSRPFTLDLLALTIKDRFEQTDRMEDLDESIQYFRTGLAERQPQETKRYNSVSNLATALLQRFFASNQQSDLEESISLYRQSLSLCPQGLPERSIQLGNLAKALEARYTHLQTAEDLEEEMDLLREAATEDLGIARPSVQLEAARMLAERARHHNRTADAFEGYQRYMRHLQRVLVMSPTLDMQHNTVGDRGMVPLDAASYAIEKGDLKRAVEILEQGRALLWAEVRQLRTPLERLADVNKSLYDAFVATTRALEALSLRAAPSEWNAASADPDGDLYGEMLKEKRALTEKLNIIIEKIRSVPNFKDFLRAKSFAALQAAAAEGPVVIINRSQYRSDVLIVLHDKDPVSVDLSRNFFSDVSSLAYELLDARHQLGTNPKKYNRVLRNTLQQTWDILVGPVVDKLKELGVEEGSRMWWCPTSMVSALPLHAAGPAATGAGSKKKTYLCDLFVSSYTPTLTALIEARTSSTAQSSPARPALLAVAQVAESLTKVEAEIDFLKNLAGCDVKLLVNDEARRETVLAGLQQRSWAHFACHGTLKSGQPFNSAFILANDERLTLLEIIKSRLPDAEFALLSACHTAEQTADSASEEVLHLAAAMQFSGFKSVVGTMWQMVDEDGPELAKSFYQEMLSKANSEHYPLEQGFKRAARALCYATKGMRKKRVELERWVNFVHIGA